MGTTESRKLKQYGWILGPVECCCTACDWALTFIANDSSVPLQIMNAFEEHNCSEYGRPDQLAPDRH
jgi:hypothetical protein